MPYLLFDGINSPRFYKWARRRVQMKVKFNYELILLPDELIRTKGKHFRIFVGEPFQINELPSRARVTICGQWHS